MSKLSFEALAQKAANTNQEELLNSVSGGTFGDCHPCQQCQQTYVTSQGSHQPLGTYLIHKLFH